MLDERADQIFATADLIAERARKVGGTTLRRIGHIHRTQRVLDKDAPYCRKTCWQSWQATTGS